MDLHFSLPIEELDVITEQLRNSFQKYQNEEEQEVSAAIVENVNIEPIPWIQGNKGYLVLIIGDDLYHLVFTYDKEGNLVDLDFRWSSKEGLTLKPLSSLGSTRLSYKNIRLVGREIIKLFENYHKIFWNCDKFLELLLKVICLENQTNLLDSSTRSTIFALSPTSCPTVSRNQTLIEAESDKIIKSSLPLIQNKKIECLLC
jgi:hypothetical protein